MPKELRGRKPRTHLSPLDLFVLTLVAQGNATVYALREKAGISESSAIPTLRWLEREQLLGRSNAGSRGKQEFSITIAGRKVLRRLAASQLYQTSLDLQAILRLIALAGMDKTAEAPHDLATKALQDRRQSRRRMPPEEPGRVNWDDPGESYRFMKLISERARVAAEITVLEHVATVLPHPRRTR
jgi:DNA-binding PadR family transcriptional regulator